MSKHKHEKPEVFVLPDSDVVVPSVDTPPPEEFALQPASSDAPPPKPAAKKAEALVPPAPTASAEDIVRQLAALSPPQLRIVHGMEVLNAAKAWVASQAPK